MKKVVSGGPVRAVAFPQADAGLPDTTFFISARSADSELGVDLGAWPPIADNEIGGLGRLNP
jgi:hypothetical protein